MIRTTVLATALMFCVSSFAQQNPPTNNSRDNQRSPSTAGVAHEGQALSPADKAAAYDKWLEPQKMSVSKSMGRDMSKMSTTERDAAWAKMSVDDKVAAYDYHAAHEKNPSKKTD